MGLKYIAPHNKTEVHWETDGKHYGFNSGIDFSQGRAILLDDLGYVVVLHKKSNKECDYVGVVFSYLGREEFKIPFPEFEYAHNLDIEFLYAGAIENGLKITFAPSSGRDFWCFFSFDERVYTTSHEAR